jgi:hypothetical protein
MKEKLKMSMDLFDVSGGEQSGEHVHPGISVRYCRSVYLLVIIDYNKH